MINTAFEGIMDSLPIIHSKIVKIPLNEFSFSVVLDLQ